NTSGTTSTLTIDGNVTGNYTGVIGAGTVSGTNDNIALTLASTNTGTLTLSQGAGNTYNGGTIINGGKLIAANSILANFSQTGSGTVTVNNSGTLGGTGTIGVNGTPTGNITVNSGGHLAPGLASGTTIGTFTALNGLTINSGSKMDIELG